LAVQSSNDTPTNADCLHMQEQENELLPEVDRIAASIQFNTIIFLDGTGVATRQVYVGANRELGDSANELTFTRRDASTAGVTIANVATGNAQSLRVQVRVKRGDRGARHRHRGHQQPSRRHRRDAESHCERHQ
jgi:flagellin-like hook-associated protein FlgL